MHERVCNHPDMWGGMPLEMQRHEVLPGVSSGFMGHLSILVSFLQISEYIHRTVCQNQSQTPKCSENTLEM